MGIREKVNQKGTVIGGLAVVAIIVAIVVIVMNTRRTPGYASSTYYSDDDGASYFRDSNKLIAPFDHNGKQAYRAHVFSCLGDSKKWVGYLEGYLPEARPKAVEVHRLMDELAANPSAAPPPQDKDPMYVLPEIQRKGLAVKQPGGSGASAESAKWVCEADGESYAKAKKPRCPHGKDHDLIEILP